MSAEASGRPFLTAQWRYLVMLNYEIDPTVLAPHVPQGTELDRWNDKVYASVVGFMFQETSVLGLRVPLHTNFEEVNLRFYVRRKAEDGWRRGVTFLREIVPRHAIAWVANTLYNENYLAVPMRHTVGLPTASQGDGTFVYEWRHAGQWQKVFATTHGALKELEEGSEEEFIAEHYWGYACGRKGGCNEYQVAHPRWRHWTVREAGLECDVAAVYGPQYAEFLGAKPASAFVAEGSPVAVYPGQKRK